MKQIGELRTMLLEDPISCNVYDWEELCYGVISQEFILCVYSTITSYLLIIYDVAAHSLSNKLVQILGKCTFLTRSEFLKISHPSTMYNFVSVYLILTGVVHGIWKMFESMFFSLVKFKAMLILWLQSIVESS